MKGIHMLEKAQKRTTGNKQVGRDEQIKALKDSEARYRRLFETARDGILILDAKTGQIADVNPYLVDMLGYTHKEFLGKKLWEIGLFKDIAASTAAFKVLQEKGYVRYQDLPLETKNGHSVNVEFVSNIYYVSGQKVIQCNIRDITARKKAENMISMSLRMLDRRKPGAQKELIHDLLTIIQELCDCEAVGIRLNDGDDYPYYEIHGFVNGHLESENGLCSRDKDGNVSRDSAGQPVLECMCGRIISGRFDPRKPYYTENGSFWTNSTTDYLRMASDKERSAIGRGRCIQEGYQSMALIPLKSPEGIVGLLQLSSLKRDRFTMDMITHFEGIGRSIGIVLNQKKSEEALKTSEEKYRGLVNNVKSGIFRSTPGAEGKFLEINKAMEEITGYSRKELLNMDVAQLYVERRTKLQFIRKMSNSKRAFKLEFKLKKKDNDEIIVAITDTPINDKTGDVIYLDGILEDITEHKKLEAKTIENETLKKVNISKSDLLANVSHELRTPLTSIKGSIESLIETDVKWSKKQQIDFLQSANLEVDRLVFLINDLLVMAKIDSGTIVLDKHNYSIREILESAGSVLSKIAAKHNLNIKLASDLPAVYADKIRIAQVITNLVENATKFSPEGSQIILSAQPNDGNVQISVEDSGIGMPPDVVANLFNRFYQAKQVVAGKTKGTGLGLAICKGIVEAHGGIIWVDSREEKGSKFYVVLHPFPDKMDCKSAGTPLRLPK
ncbi:MAG TPA: PAS domain S-box protein [Dehalococcoidales bacterium]